MKGRLQRPRYPELDKQRMDAQQHPGAGGDRRKIGNVLYVVSYVCDRREIQKLESSKRMNGRCCARQNIRIVPCYPHFTAQNNFVNKELNSITKVRLVPQDDSSPDDQIRLQLVSVPMYGILTRSQSQQEHQELREYSSVTMEDINKHRIRYG